jgi:hypothetical protein
MSKVDEVSEAVAVDLLVSVKGVGTIGTIPSIWKLLSDLLVWFVTTTS